MEIMHKKIWEQRQKMGGINASRENNQAIAKQIQILENRLDKVRAAFVCHRGVTLLHVCKAAQLGTAASLYSRPPRLPGAQEVQRSVGKQQKASREHRQLAPGEAGLRSDLQEAREGAAA